MGLLNALNKIPSQLFLIIHKTTDILVLSVHTYITDYAMTKGTNVLYKSVDFNLYITDNIFKMITILCSNKHFVQSFRENYSK